MVIKRKKLEDCKTWEEIFDFQSRKDGVIHFLKREWHKLAFYEGRGNNRNKGKFKVLYDDGRISENICWKVANDYAQMFKGKVLDSF